MTSTKIPATNRPMFHQSEITILERGLNSLTLACDALTQLNKQLNELNEELKAENDRLLKSIELLRR
jgi:phenylalanyl-tRNA synthetase alpha subunit